MTILITITMERAYISNSAFDRVPC
jgi:hypothetical protein